MHQPLHISDNDDQGGNAIKVTVGGFKHTSKDELHGYWDTQFVDAIAKPPTALAKKLLAQITSDQQHRNLIGPPIDVDHGVVAARPGTSRTARARRSCTCWDTVRETTAVRFLDSEQQHSFNLPWYFPQSSPARQVDVGAYAVQPSCCNHRPCANSEFSFGLTD
jgi:hypothetical protein